MRHSAEYLAHLQSPEWRAVRARILSRARGVCEECETAPATEVHHLTYERLGHELDSDLQALCRPCHALADEVREHDAPRKRYERGLRTYASKRWGEDALDTGDPDQMEDAFDAWLERKIEQ